MNSIRKWLYKPKRSDKSLLAQFYFADDELNTVASELDSFDSRKDPERCQALVAQLRTCQDRVLTIIQSMMTEAIPFSRSSRDFRVKFPDDVVQENLAGQLWFGAECLAAGSSIMNREVESASMRPLARALTKNLDSLRHILRDQCLININEYSERIREALTIFDKLFAEFELSYVSAMVPVKSVKEYETIQEITVLFSETVIRAKARGYVTTDMIDEYDPALMFTIPRLAIICGLLMFGDGPLNPDHQSLNMSDMFRPFQTLLYKIRELLYTLSEAELLTLERALCSQEEPDFLSSAVCEQALAMTSSCVSTSTIAVQTDSPVLGRKRTDSEASCSSIDQLDHKGFSGDVSLTEGEQQRKVVDRNRSVEHISCQWGRLSETPPSDAAFCELEEGAAGQTATQDCSRQSKNLNKSDSNDSGLHSDVVSACDSQFTVSPSGSSQLISQAGCASTQQDLLVEEVIEICLEHSDTETLTTQDPRPSSLAEYACEVNCTVEHDRGPKKDGCDETLISREDQNYASPLCEDFEDERLSGEEDSFYTPSSGVSPLHQPSSDGETRPESHQTVPRGLEMVTHDSLQSVSSVEDTDDNKENIEGHVAGSSLLEHRISEDSSEDMYNTMLQRVQQTIVSLSRSCLEEETGSGDNVSDVNNSSLTDSTLTDITPPDCNSPPKLSTEEPQLHFCSCADGGNRTLGIAECERCLLQIPCGPLQSEMVVSVSELASEAGVAAASLDGYCAAVDLSDDCEMDNGVETSQNQCDRCTQTPHSAINNDQSSKIYHHHHHHCHNVQSHSLSSHQAGSASSSVPVHHTPASCDSKQRNSSRHDSGKRNSSDTAQQSSVNVRTSSKKKSGVEESPRRAGKRARGSKSRKSSLRTRKQKASQQSEAEREARLRQYENNWSICSNSTISDSERKGRRTADKALAETSSGSSCEEDTSTSDCESNEESCGSSETSSYNSESHDDEEIALAVQAAELANRNQARARFRSSSDMIHRLFVCISGVADQLQTNFAGDLRNILRVVFNLNCSESVIIEDEKTFRHHRRRAARLFPPNFGGAPQSRSSRDPPVWLPDDQSTMCMSCKTTFTFVRRRHHCRNCGKIFCGRCSSNAVSLPHFGHSKPVRVCNHCFVFQVNPFSMQTHL